MLTYGVGKSKKAIIQEIRKATDGQNDAGGLVNVLEQGLNLEATRYARIPVYKRLRLDNAGGQITSLTGYREVGFRG